MMSRFAFVVSLLAALVVCAWPSIARAEVQRFAVVIGNNKGDGSDADLKYAESDAARVYDVLKDLGGFEPADMVLLRGESAPTIMRTVIALNDRVRAAVGRDGTEAVLFVYFSGHADASALHLSSTRLDLTQLEQLVRGSAATFRVLMLDACRSGALTRIKGGQSAPPFALNLGEHLSGAGLAYLTSSAANEDAQESDEIRGSFFTHHFTSALLGAGDIDGDGRVTLEEAYRYAYDATVRATSRTWAGLQHPAFRYDLRGGGKLALTTLGGGRSPRATLSFPVQRTYLVLEKSASGAVVAEVDAVDRTRRISLRPGRYFIRGRLPDAMLEGELDLRAGAETGVRDDALRRTEYARLVRKGGADVRTSHGVEAGYLLRTPMKNATSLCQGAFAGYVQHRPALDLGARLDFCHAGAESETISSSADELGGELRASHGWDLPYVTITVGLGVRGSWLRQSFSTAGVAPTRHTPAGAFGPSLGLTFPLGRGFSLGAESAAMTYVFEQSSGASTSLGPWFAFRQLASLEKEW